MVVCGLKFKMQVLNPAITLWEVGGPLGLLGTPKLCPSPLLHHPLQEGDGIKSWHPGARQERAARSLNGRIIEDGLGSCQLDGLGLIWFNFALMFLSPVVLWRSWRGGRGAAASCCWRAGGGRLGFGQSSSER